MHGTPVLEDNDEHDGDPSCRPTVPTAMMMMMMMIMMMIMMTMTKGDEE